MTISERTQAALVAHRDRQGVEKEPRRRSPGAPPEARARALEKAHRVAREKAAAASADVLPMVVELRASGLSLAGIASVLNAEGLTTRRGKPWGQVQVSRVLQRAASQANPIEPIRPGAAPVG